MDAQAAAAALDDIAALRAATRRSLGYRLASVKLILWGGIVAVANVLTYLFPEKPGRIWIVMTAIGLVASMILGRRLMRAGYGTAWRFLAGFLLFLAFGSGRAGLDHLFIRPSGGDGELIQEDPRYVRDAA